MTHIHKRQVFYISGFDPRGAGHYYKLYKTQNIKQSAINGLNTTISRRVKLNQHSHQWVLNTASAEGAQTETTYNFLAWDDIIREHWSAGIKAIISDMLLFIHAFILTGLVFRITRISPNVKIAAFYPLIYILTILILSTAMIIAAIIFGGPFIGLLGLIAAIGIIFFAIRQGNKLGVFWLLRLYVFSTRWANGDVARIDERINLFAKEITEAIQNPENDEILLVSHSVGTMLAISTVAKLTEVDERFTLITLGHCIPLLSLQTNAAKFREELQSLGSKPQLNWLDYSIPSDSICFAQVDPLAATGLNTAENRPVLLSPRFFQLYSPARYKKLKREWYNMHFLYIMAAEIAGNYDYFIMTAGPNSIRAKNS